MKRVKVLESLTCIRSSLLRKFRNFLKNSETYYRSKPSPPVGGIQLCYRYVAGKGRGTTKSVGPVPVSEGGRQAVHLCFCFLGPLTSGTTAFVRLVTILGFGDRLISHVTYLTIVHRNYELNPPPRLFSWSSRVEEQLRNG